MPVHLELKECPKFPVFLQKKQAPKKVKRLCFQSLALPALCAAGEGQAMHDLDSRNGRLFEPFRTHIFDECEGFWVSELERR